jgi:acetylornithine deacetylase/succinyl-diaminopimelate desuccinylase-like protein
MLGPIEKVSNEIWPGVPVVPWMEAGATDGKALNAVGIPTYGVNGLFVGGDMGNIHGLNEHILVKSVMDAREFLTRLVKTYADERSPTFGE